MDAPKAKLNPAIVAQFVKFGIVGVSNTLLTLAVYTALIKGFDMWYLAASAIGYAVGMVNGFLWNRSWTFRGHVGDALTPVRWFVVQGCGLAANLGWCSCSCTTPAWTSSSGRRARRRSWWCSRSSPTAPGPSAWTPTALPQHD